MLQDKKENVLNVNFAEKQDINYEKIDENNAKQNLIGVDSKYFKQKIINK